MRILLISVAAAGLLLGFQNCSEVSFETSLASKMDEVNFLKSAFIMIDDDAEFTRQSQVQLKMNSTRAVEMKISNLENCADGDWEPFTTAKAWTLTKTNQKASVHAVFRDFNGVVTACSTDEITHDDQPPTATFANAPGVITNDPVTNVTWTSSDNLSGVLGTICKGPDNAAVACTNLFMVRAAADGAQSVSVRVSDKAGNQTPELRYDWLYDSTKPTVSINSQPAAVTGSAAASFTFTGQDALAGISKYVCKIDGGAAADCVSPFTKSGLTDGNHAFEVVAVDRAGNASAPALANWRVDMTAPSLQFTQTPTAISVSRAANFSFTGIDDGQPITRFECKLDSGNFVACTSPVANANLSEGPHSFEVRGYDTAGNISSPIKYSWVIDVSNPIVTITSGPPALGNSSTVNFGWSASDAGSGIKLVECRIDNGAYQTCGAAGQSFANLAAGNHTLEVRATDNAGNLGSASRAWAIDLTAPVIQITSGPTDYVRETSSSFAFTATDASGIAGYECRVDSGNYASCASPKVVSMLAEGGHAFFVRAIDSAGNVSVPASRSWTIDLSPPVIRVLSAPVAIKQGDSAAIDYEVLDLASGVDKVTCTFSGDGSIARDCVAKQKLDLGNALAVGSYVFEIKATDKVGNTLSEKVNFQVTAKVLICDPFKVGGDATCRGGLVGDIFYLNPTHQTAFKALNNKTVDYFYANGIQVNALLNLEQLYVTTRSFTAGFPSSTGALIKDDSGATLTEYFAFRLETVLKLDIAKDQPGWYQFATISDDGSMVLTKPAGSSTYSSVVVANDGDHSTGMRCSQSAVYIDDATRLPLQVKYYQGPRTEIALSFMWRRVAAMNSAADGNCGTSFTDLAPLFASGWQIVAPSNMVAPPR